MCLLGNGVVPKTAEKAEHGSGLCASSGRPWRESGAGSPAAPGMPSGRSSRPSSALSTCARPCTEPCLVEKTHLGDAGGFLFSCLVPTNFWFIRKTCVYRNTERMTMVEPLAASGNSREETTDGRNNSAANGWRREWGILNGRSLQQSTFRDSLRAPCDL